MAGDGAAAEMDPLAEMMNFANAANDDNNAIEAALSQNNESMDFARQSSIWQANKMVMSI